MAQDMFSYDLIRFSRKERLPTSFVATDFHPIEGRNGECLMVTALEINSPWHHAREFGQQIITTLVREFVRSQSNSNLIRFEHALKLANHTISQAADKLGVSIDCAVALFIGEEVHFTVIGNCRLLLFRNGHLTDVTATDTAEPGQFSSVTSGDLANQEWLMAATEKTVGFLRAQDPEIWQEADADAIAAQLIEEAPALERNHYFATLVRFRTDRLGQSQTVLWDNLEHKTPIQLPKMTLPKINFSGAIAWLSETWVKLRALTKRKVRTAEQPAVETANADQPTTEIFEAGPSVISRLRSLPWPRVSRRSLIIAAVVLVVLFVGYKVAAGRIDRAKEAVTEPTILEQLTQIPVANRQEFLAANFNFDRYAELSDAEKQTFAARVEESGAAFIQPTTVIAKLENEIVAIDGSATTLAALDNTGQLWVVRDGRVVKTEQSAFVKPALSVAVVNNERIVATDAAGNIWLFDGTTTGQPVALTQPSLLGTGPKLVQAYNGNLYIYATELKTVYRQSNFDKELSAPRSVGRFDQMTSSLTDWAINGAVVGLSEQGQVMAFQGGKVTLNSSLAKVSPPLHLASLETVPKLAALSAAFLIISDKTLASPSLRFLALKAPPTDLAINVTDSSLWLASGREIFKVSL